MKKTINLLTILPIILGVIGCLLIRYPLFAFLFGIIGLIIGIILLVKKILPKYIIWIGIVLSAFALLSIVPMLSVLFAFYNWI